MCKLRKEKLFFSALYIACCLSGDEKTSLKKDGRRFADYKSACAEEIGSAECGLCVRCATFADLRLLINFFVFIFTLFRTLRERKWKKERKRGGQLKIVKGKQKEAQNGAINCLLSIFLFISVKLHRNILFII